MPGSAQPKRQVLLAASLTRTAMRPNVEPQLLTMQRERLTSSSRNDSTSRVVRAWRVDGIAWWTCSPSAQRIPVGAPIQLRRRPETSMKKTRFGIIVAITLALACIVPTNLLAESKAEKQEDIQKMAQQTLQQLYQA